MWIEAPTRREGGENIPPDPRSLRCSCWPQYGSVGEHRWGHCDAQCFGRPPHAARNQTYSGSVGVCAGGFASALQYVPRSCRARFGEAAVAGGRNAKLALEGTISKGPAPQVSPLTWGDQRHATDLLGPDFDLMFERGVNNAYHPDTEHIWQKYAHGFGPMRQLISDLRAEQGAALRADVDAYHRAYASDAGLHVKREYLLLLGKRR